MIHRAKTAPLFHPFRVFSFSYSSRRPTTRQGRSMLLASNIFSCWIFSTLCWPK